MSAMNRRSLKNRRSNQSEISLPQAVMEVRNPGLKTIILRFSELRFAPSETSTFGLKKCVSTPWRNLGRFRRETKVQYLTDESGSRTAVVLSISDYEELMEDLADLAAIADRRSEPSTPHSEFLEELRRDGILQGRRLSGSLRDIRRSFDRRGDPRRTSERRLPQIVLNF